MDAVHPLLATFPGPERQINVDGVFDLERTQKQQPNLYVVSSKFKCQTAIRSVTHLQLLTLRGFSVSIDELLVEPQFEHVRLALVLLFLFVPEDASNNRSVTHKFRNLMTENDGDAVYVRFHTEALLVEEAEVLQRGFVAFVFVEGQCRHILPQKIKITTYANDHNNKQKK